MAYRAILRCGLVKQDRLCGDYFRQLMAISAAHILMRPAQREGCALVVVEERRLPLHARVALGAVRNVHL